MNIENAHVFNKIHAEIRLFFNEITANRLPINSVDDFSTQFFASERFSHSIKFNLILERHKAIFPSSICLIKMSEEIIASDPSSSREIRQNKKKK